MNRIVHLINVLSVYIFHKAEVQPLHIRGVESVV